MTKPAPKLPVDALRSLHGSLQQTTFAELLIALLARQSSGTLRVRGAGGAVQAEVRFERGLPVAARMGAPGETLAQSLIPLCACADADYDFVPRDDVGSGEGVVSGGVDPLALINAAMRGPVREDAIERTLSALGERPLRLASELPEERYMFTPQEREVVSWLEGGPRTVAELLAAPGANVRLVRRVIYVLAITRGATPLPGQRMHSGAIERVAPPKPAASVAPPPAPSGRYHVHYAEGGPADIVPSAPPRSAPPRPSAPPSRSLPPSEQSRRERVAEAEAQHREAVRLLRRSDYPAALHCAHEALRSDGRAANEALYGWLLYLTGGDPNRPPPRSFRHLERALQREPDCVDAHYYLGVLLRRIGNDGEANVHFKRCLRLDPMHDDAARELRLWQMRRRANSGSGFLKKLFGGK